MSQSFVAFDLETTGLYPIKDKIVEIGAVRFNGDKTIDTFQSLVNPGISIPEEVIAIHGITNEMVRNAPFEKDAVEIFLDFIKSDILLAHNAPFDAGFIMAAVAQYKISVPRNSLVDTCELAKKFIKGVKNYKLSTLGEYLNIKDTRYHRAMADAVAGMEVFRAVIRNLPKDTPADSIPFRTGQSLKLDDFVFDNIDLDPDKLLLKDAVKEGFDVCIEYRNGNGEYSKRQVSPFNLYCFRGKGYLAAFCRQAQEPRQFRVDRLVSVSKIG
ncbi:MAG: exonuclease domain-containing protein [Candidatus Brocadiia bacterium]